MKEQNLPVGVKRMVCKRMICLDALNADRRKSSGPKRQALPNNRELQSHNQSGLFLRSSQ
jgi:hypothetical protein